MDRMIYTIIANLIFFTIIFFSILFHEIGHMLVHKFFTKSHEWEIKIGLGDPMIKVGKFTINLFFMITGIFVPTQKIKGKKARIFCFFGGPLMNILIIGIVRLFTLFFYFKDTFLIGFLIDATINYNIFLLVVTLFPWKMPYNGGIDSDGLRIYRELSTKE